MLAAALILLAACAPESPTDHPVRATLDDGQVLMGSVQTETLQLITGFGAVEVPLSDIGEVRPVEGGALGGSGNHVSVWLRNGAELRGEWAEPELRMGLEIDQRVVPADLPMDQLERFQLQGGDLLPAGIVYRVRTVYGDDFVVDADATWIRIANELGSFTPTLAEIEHLSLELGGDAFVEPQLDWHMSLSTGTVLIGELTGTGDDPAVITLALPLGPDEVSVPIEDIVSVERQDWGSYERYRGESLQALGYVDAEPAAASEEAWFDNRIQQDFKAIH